MMNRQARRIHGKTVIHIVYHNDGTVCNQVPRSERRNNESTLYSDRSQWDAFIRSFVAGGDTTFISRSITMSVIIRKIKKLHAQNEPCHHGNVSQLT